MMILKNINHINIIVKDFAQSQDFFEHFLELQPHSSDERAYLVGEDGPILVVLEFPPMQVPDLEQDKHQCFRSISFEVPDLKKLVKRALDCGYQPFIFNNDADESPHHPLEGIDIESLTDHQKVSVRDIDANLWHFCQTG